MKCKKKCSLPLLVSSSVAESDSTLKVTVPTQTINNGSTYILMIMQTIPTIATPTPIVIGVGNSTIGLYNRCGNKIYSDQVQTNTPYYIKFSTDTPLAIKFDGTPLIPTKFKFTSITG